MSESWHGHQVYRLDGPSAALAVVPARGGKIVSLRTAGREWLSQSGTSVMAPGSSFVSAEMCGWDECCPSILAATDEGVTYSDHGDAWDAEWQVVHTSPQAIALAVDGRDWPYRLQRTIEPTQGGFRMSYEVVSHDTVTRPFLWAAHPQFLAEPGSRVEIPGIDKICDYRDSDDVAAFDPRLPGVPIGATAKVWTLPTDDPTQAILQHPDEQWLRLTWTAPVRCVGIWIDAAAIAKDRIVAIEPSTGWFDSVSKARAAGEVLLLEPGQRADWTLNVAVGGGHP